MLYVCMALFAGAIVLADQLSKGWIVNHIASSICGLDTEVCARHIEVLQEQFHLTEQQLEGLPASLPGISGLFHLVHVHNTGAAWSSFQGMIWLFALVFAVFTGLVIWEFSQKRMPFTNFERWCIAAVFGGGLGNMIDRLRLGFVVDMIEVEFMSFPVFNVADCFITCGCIALMVSLIFFNKEFWKDEKK